MGSYKDFAPDGAFGRSATFRSLQRANGRARWKIFVRADLRKLKRRERRAPDAEFGERFPRVGTPRLPAQTANPGLMDWNPVGICGRCAIWILF